MTASMDILPRWRPAAAPAAHAPALAEGNVIQLNEIELGIVEACSGLRMLVVFFALSTAVALLIRKPLWEKTLIAFSAIPIALASNILRITVTGIVYEVLGDGFG